MLGFCESINCRREGLLRYFGEDYQAPCNNCDNCHYPPQTQDESENARIALSCIYRSGQRFGVNYIIDLLLGKENEKILKNRHHMLSTFGMGKHLSAPAWRNIFRQLLAHAYIIADPDNYGGLRLDEKCRRLLRNEESFFCRVADTIKDKSKASSYESEALSEYDKSLFEKLKSLRSELADVSNVPAYVIFHNKTLQQISAIRPKSLDELRHISGIGEKKLQLYGDRLIQTIKDYLQGVENKSDLLCETAD